MSDILQQIVNGITLGCIYCLIASGLTIVYSVMYVPNFAQGSLFMVGAFIGFYLFPLVNSNYWLTLLGSAISLAGIGVVIDKFLFRPVRDDPHVNSFVVSLGLLMVLEGIITILCGEDYKNFKTPYDTVNSLGGLAITTQRIIVILSTGLILGLLQLFLAKTKIGMSVIAMSQNTELALMVGINVNRVSVVAFAISTALAGVAGVLIAPLLLVYPEMGTAPLLIAFAAVIFGGLGSLPGAALGAFIMALAQVFCIHFASSVFSHIAIFGVMIVILIFKPTGLFGEDR